MGDKPSTDSRARPQQSSEPDVLDIPFAPSISPGKQTLTMRLPPRSASAPAPVVPVQAKVGPATHTLHTEHAGLLESWMDLAMRPDLHAQPVQRMRAPGASFPAFQPPASQSSGQPMPASVQAKMEHAFDTDFSAVRIYQGPQARAMGALAYTQGSNIHFAPGQYDPGSQRGQELLGHELTHVMQQRAGRVSLSQGKGAPINADPALEAEADRLGAEAARGHRVAVSGASSRPDNAQSMLAAGTSAATGAIQRKAELVRGTAPSLDTPLGALASQLPGVNSFFLDASNPLIALGPTDKDYSPQRARPQDITATIEGSRRLDDRGSGKDQSITSIIGHLGDQERLIRRGERAALFRGGHLVGDQLLPDSIDSFVDWNLAPQHVEFNAPVYSNTFEALVAKGPKDQHGAFKQGIPIKIKVTLGYDATSFSVTVQELIDRGVVNKAEITTTNIPLTQAVTIPTRVPSTWKAEANIDTSALKDGDASRTWALDTVDITDKIDGYRDDALDRSTLPADDFSWKADNIGKNPLTSKNTIGGHPSLTMEGVHGSQDASNANATVSRTAATGSVASLTPIFGSPIEPNDMDTDELQDALNSHSDFSKSLITSFSTAFVRFRPEEGYQDMSDAFSTITASGKGKLKVSKGTKTYQNVLNILNPSNMQYTKRVKPSTLIPAVVKAVIDLHNPGGSPAKDIMNYVRANGHADASTLSITLALKKAEDAGKLKRSKGAYSLATG